MNWIYFIFGFLAFPVLVVAAFVLAFLFSSKVDDKGNDDESDQNGVPWATLPEPDKNISDTQRMDFLERHVYSNDIMNYSDLTGFYDGGSAFSLVEGPIRSGQLRASVDLAIKRDET